MSLNAAEGVRVKICGLTRPEDARSAADAGADYAGVILSPGFSRSVSVDRAREILGAWVGQRVGVLVDPDPSGAVGLARELALDVLQLHGHEAPAVVERVRGAGGWQLWKSFHARDDGKAGDALTDTMRSYAGLIDGALLDTWDPELPGGSGRTFGWSGVSDLVRGALGDVTFIAAGGLKPDNVRAAVAALAPDVLDVSSGVESEVGVKDPARLKAFVSAARPGAATGRPF